MQVGELGVAAVRSYKLAMVPLVGTVARRYRGATLEEVATSIAKLNSGPIMQQLRPNAECGVDS